MHQDNEMNAEDKKDQSSKKATMAMFSSYYQHFFPYTEIANWLSYCRPSKPDQYNEYFRNREFSFTLEGDIYIRYQSFNNASDLKATLVQKNPVKIDIGAIFNLQPKYNKQYKKAEEQTLTPLEKELVFDIDMTDYDPVRTCCQDTKICQKCWKFIKVAYEILDAALREDFGFKNLLWVYSGRRGIHCWVCDRRARKLTNECRESVVGYLSVYAGNDNSDVRPNVSWPLHPSLKRAIKIMEKYINVILEEQKLLELDKHRNTLLKLIGDNNVDLINQVNEAWAKCSTSVERWEKYKAIIKSHETEKYATLRLAVEAMFKFLYPRLDANVSKSRNHLLKSVFSLHPSTGNVCVPIENIEIFNPMTTPTINNLLAEQTDYLRRGGDPSKFVENSSMGSYVNYFQRFVEGLPKLQFNTIEEMQAEGEQEKMRLD